MSTRRGFGATVLAIEIILSQQGPMTRSQIEDELGLGKAQVSAVLTRMRRRGKDGVKRIYVIRWVDSHEGGRRYPRAVYALGDRKCATKPKPDLTANKRRYLQSKRSVLKGNFVFNLGLTDKQIGVHT
jgi:DNA-binding MarR family transcriptional regulator